MPKFYGIDQEIFFEYQKLKKKTNEKLFEEQAVKDKFKQIYLNIKKTNKSLAKLSNIFNAKIPGFNSKLHLKIEKDLEQNKINFPVSLKLCRSLKKYAEHNDEIKLINDRLIKIEKEILEAYLPLSFKAAKKYSSNIFNIDINDSIQEANKGILEAIEKFDCNRKNRLGDNVKFSTYAYIYATKKIKDWIMNQSRLVRIPRNKLKVIFLLLEVVNTTTARDIYTLTHKINKLLIKKKGRNLTEEEFLEEKDIIEAITLLNGNSLSIDKKNTFTFEENSRPKTIGDFLQSNDKTPEENLLQKNNRDQLFLTFKKALSPLEIFILQEKFFSFKEKSLKEIQEELLSKGKKLSRERINQIKNEALEKLRSVPNFKELLRENI